MGKMLQKIINQKKAQNLKKIFKKFKEIAQDSKNKFKYINNHNKGKWAKVAN